LHDSPPDGRFAHDVPHLRMSAPAFPYLT
jgi:hypothetical protein